MLFGYASLVGVVVGAIEILQRYRDAPFRALFTGWGIGYMLLNRAVRYGAATLLLGRAASPIQRGVAPTPWATNCRRERRIRAPLATSGTLSRSASDQPPFT